MGCSEFLCLPSYELNNLKIDCHPDKVRANKVKCQQKLRQHLRLVQQSRILRDNHRVTTAQSVIIYASCAFQHGARFDILQAPL